MRWYLRYKLSYRDLVEIISERSLSTSHTTVLRWVQRYAPEFDKRWSRFVIAATQKDEEANRVWFAEVKKLKASVREREGVDYDGNPAWTDAWDSEVKRLAHQPENGDKPARWFLERARMNVKPQLSKNSYSGTLRTS